MEYWSNGVAVSLGRVWIGSITPSLPYSLTSRLGARVRLRLRLRTDNSDKQRASGGHFPRLLLCSAGFEARRLLTVRSRQLTGLRRKLLKFFRSKLHRRFREAASAPVLTSIVTV